MTHSTIANLQTARATLATLLEQLEGNQATLARTALDAVSSVVRSRPPRRAIMPAYHRAPVAD